MITRDNFHIKTRCTWSRLKYGNQAQTMFDALKSEKGVDVIKSPISSSMYLIKGDIIYRFSDHWGNFGTVSWFLDRPLEKWQLLQKEWVLAYSPLCNFILKY